MWLDIEQNTPEWEEMRRTKIGASDLPIIMGLSPYKTAYELYLEKLLLKLSPPMTKNMEYGHEKEEEMRIRVSEMIGIPFKKGVCVHDKYDWAMASFDGYFENVACELKQANAQDHALAKKGKVPTKYYPQVQWQLFCPDLDVNYYCSEHKNEIVIVEVKPDEKYITESFNIAERFYSCIQQRRPPAMTEKDLEYKDDILTVDLVRDYRAAYEEKARLKKLMEEAEKVLQDRAAALWGHVGKPCQGRDFKLLERTRRGLVDYKKLCDEQGIPDEIVELYRKDTVLIKEIALS